MRYRLLEHTADAMVEAYGNTLGERFANAAYALFDQMTDVTKVSPTGEVKLELEADGREQLLFLHDVENLVFGEFSVDTDGTKLVAIARGENFDEEKHTKRSVVKGVTYHRLEIDDSRKALAARFDVRG